MTLQHEIKIIVPSTKNADESSDLQPAMVDYCLSTLSVLNGGATASNGTGGWMSDEKGLIKESVVVINSSCAELTESLLESVYAMAVKILTDMSQEAVSLYVDGKLYLIFPE